MTKHDNVSQGIMKATEFVKEYGIDTARECLEERPKDWESCYLKLSNFELVKYIPSPLDFIDVDDLKRLVESHEILGLFKSLDQAKADVAACEYAGHADLLVKLDCGIGYINIARVKQAIADVEACQ